MDGVELVAGAVEFSVKTEPFVFKGETVAKSRRWGESILHHSKVR